MTPALFGVLILDRDPYVFADLPGLAQAWLQDAGGFAFVGLCVYLLYALRMPAEQVASARARAGVTSWMLAMTVVALGFYALAAFLLVTGKGVDTVNVKVYSTDPGMYIKYVPPKLTWDRQPLALTLGGLAALAGIMQPFVMSLLKIRATRLWALTLLGFKEAIRMHLFWVFLLALIPSFFPAKWFVPIKPEDELRSTLAITSFFMNFVLLVPAAVLAAFSIPNDIRNQNIYTIVTKPVERFEILLGRFVGYVGMMTLALAIMVAASWVLIRSAGVDERAKDETFKARVPLRGKLAFQSRRVDFVGTNVGREFDYRKYIAGDPASPQRALWSFAELPRGLAGADREYVPCEFTFDIFRMTKGVENRGVDIVVRFTTWQSPQVPPGADSKDPNWKWADPERERQYQEEAKRLVREFRKLPAAEDVNPAATLARARPGTPEWAIVNELTEKFGYYERTGKEIDDYHPHDVAIPVGLLRNALQPGLKADAKGVAPPRLQVSVKCQSAGQMLGMAEGDLYLIEGVRTFDENYFKASVGLWCRMTILIGLAVVMSTYLTAVISLVGAALLFVCGYGIEHIADMSSGQSYAGGPLRAMSSLLKAEMPTAQPDPNSVFTGILGRGDAGFSWLTRRFINMIPDVESFAWTTYVAEGFNVPIECLVMNVLVTAAYLLPWFVLGYYLMRSREVAA